MDMTRDLWVVLTISYSTDYLQQIVRIGICISAPPKTGSLIVEESDLEKKAMLSVDVYSVN